MAEKPDVAAVIVNYNSGAFAVEAVKSLRAQRFRGREGGPGRLEIVVVENASPHDQEPWLRRLEELGCVVVRSPENLGYGGGANLGLQSTTADFVLVMNPDVLVLRGALEAMLSALRERSDAAAAGPRGYLDPALFVQLPAIELPTLSGHLLESLARIDPRVGRFASRRMARRSLAVWSASAPLERRMLSGYAVLMRGDEARRFGPFDEGFPFYFEDADLSRRFTCAGRRLLLVPGARMIHLFDRSARTARDEVLAKYDVSRAYYFRKHYGPAGASLYEKANARVRSAGTRGSSFQRADDLGRRDEPVRLTWGFETDYVVELATDPSLLFAGGNVGRGERLEIPRATWNVLAPTRWFLRVSRVGDLQTLAYVTFEKSVPDLEPPGFDALGGGGEGP